MERFPKAAPRCFICPSQRFRATTYWQVLLALAILAVLASLFAPIVSKVHEPSRQTVCRNRLRIISIALQNYHSSYGCFPPAYTVDSNGRRLHSWRTLLLPFLDQAVLGRMVDYSKPWDDPANAKVREVSIRAFTCPSVDSMSGKTQYLGIVTPDSVLNRECRRIADITDGLSHTWMLIEVTPEHSVHWMEPADADEPLVQAMATHAISRHPAGLHILNADGEVDFGDEKLTAEEIRARITISGRD